MSELIVDYEWLAIQDLERLRAATMQSIADEVAVRQMSLVCVLLTCILVVWL